MNTHYKGWKLVACADGAAVAEHVAACLLRDRQRWPDQPLGLATGRTMEPVYGALVKAVHALPVVEQQRLRQQWLSFNLDEYVGLAPGDAGSFAAFMALHLQQPLALGMDQVRLPAGLASDPGGEAQRYATDLARCGGLGLQLLGLGLNGHVGFNEPPCPATAPCRCLELSSTTRDQNAAAFGGDAQAVPEQAITLGLAEILAAQRLLLVVTGAAKAGILARLLAEQPSPALPASWLQGHTNLTLVADQAALGECGAIDQCFS
ncbi:MAG: glucosamine-6-phosphate deaminase [Cyanobium sp. LacPavin_0920_WC12_MAG_62_9]|nr:glucosamine-6-phosphate deaminase [Cyanobium sp. LacPavin_0920_WC12_MAG_62_9]